MECGGLKYGQHQKSNHLTQSPQFSAFCSFACFELVTRLTLSLISVTHVG